MYKIYFIVSLIAIVFLSWDYTNYIESTDTTSIEVKYYMSSINDVEQSYYNGCIESINDVQLCQMKSAKYISNYIKSKNK